MEFLPTAHGAMNWSKRESEVVSDLISLYPRLFLVDSEELAREQKMQEVLERYHNPSSNPPRPSGDLRVWIHISSVNSGQAISIAVGPLCVAGEVCSDLSEQLSLASHQVSLNEIVCGGALSRPLHHSESVLDVVLRWGYWDTEDCKDNYLVLTPNTVYSELAPIAKPPLTKCGELRFADQKAKNFKTFVFEFNQAKLSYYKDKACSVKLGEWKVEDIVWYIGHEPKRNPQMRWAITFINKKLKPKRSKESPYFGWTIAGTNKADQMKWMAAMLVGEYSQIMPDLHNLIQ